MNSAYSTGLPRKAMRVMAGFTIQPGQFFLARAALDPPEDLMKLVFPLLDQWNDRLLTKYDNQNNGDSMQVTVAAKACFDLFFRPEKINFARRRGNDGQGSKSPSLDQRNLCESYVFGVLGVCKISIIKVHHNEMADQLIFNQTRKSCDPAHVLLKRCVPIIGTKLKTLHNNLSIRLSQQAEKQDVLNDFITRLVNGQASVNLAVNMPSLNQTIQTNSVPSGTSAGPTALTEPAASASIPVAAAAAATSSSSVPPTYLMSRGIVSLGDLWREWSQGLCGGPAVMDLERRYGTRWREDASVKKFFLRRNGVVKVIQDYAKNNHLDMKTALAIAEKRRVANKRSIHWLSDNKHEIFGSS